MDFSSPLKYTLPRPIPAGPVLVTTGGIVDPLNSAVNVPPTSPTSVINPPINNLDLYTTRQNHSTLHPEHFDPKLALEDRHSLKTQLLYWRQQLGVNPPVCEFPADYLRPAVQTFNRSSYQLTLTQELSEQWRLFSSQQGQPLFNTLLTAFQILLNQYLKTDDIITGGPLGFGSPTVVLRTDLGDNPSFSDFLDQLSKIITAAAAHSEVSFAQLVSKLVKKKDASRSPLFQIGFALDTPDAIQLSVTESDNQPYSEFGLTVETQQSDWALRLDYNPDLFSEETINSFLNNYEMLLETILATPAAPLSDLGKLSEKQRVKTLNDFNATEQALPDGSIASLFEAQVQKHPNRLAIAYANDSLTYRQLNEKANQLAHYLEQKGLRPGGLVAIWMDRSPEFVVAVLAILKAGAAYLPLDTQCPEDRLSFVMEDAGADLAIVSSRIRPWFYEPCPAIDLDSLTDELAHQPTANKSLIVAPDSLAYVMYTSGTTGRPNGVEVTQTGIIRLVHNTNYFPFEAPHTFLQLASLGFDAATFELWGALLHGNPCILYPGRVPELHVLKQLIRDYSISCLWLTASLFNFIIDESPETLTGVSWILTGGEALSVPHVRKAQQLLPHTQLVNGYGPTENTTFTCCYAIPPLNDRKIASIPVGGPIGNTQVYILDAQQNPLPVGMVGEIYNGGKGLARGYRNRPQLTAQKFVANPFSTDPQEKLYKTGDLGRWLPDGTVEFMGRVDKQIKLRGFRIEPAEIEQVILKDEAISNCVVTVKEMAGNKELVAYLQPANWEARPDHQALINRLKGILPAYMIPPFFVDLERFPLTINGKIDQAKLPLPEKTIAIPKEAEAPVTPTEQWMLAIWKDVFQHDAITINDNFLELGGHSLMAAKIITRINKTANITLNLPALFESPTVKQLAGSVDTKKKVSSYVFPLKGGTGTPVFLFAGLGGNPFSYRTFAQYYSSSEPLYGVFYPDENQPFATLQDYVTEVVKEINGLMPDGLCSLVGYSLGGRVAFETALQLQQQQKSVHHLCLISAYPTDFYRKGDSPVDTLKFNLKIFKESPRRLKAQYIKHRLPDFVNKFTKAKLLHQPTDLLGIQYADEPIFQLWKAYKMERKYKGNVLIIKEHTDWLEPAYNEYYFSHIYPDLLWSKYIDGPIQINTVACGHEEILLDGFVEESVNFYTSFLHS